MGMLAGDGASKGASSLACCFLEKNPKTIVAWYMSASLDLLAVDRDQVGMRASEISGRLQGMYVDLCSQEVGILQPNAR